MIYASSQRRIVILLRKKPDIVFKGESGRLVGKEASGDQGAKRIDQKDQHKSDHYHLDPEPEIQFFPGCYHEITSWVAASYTPTARISKFTFTFSPSGLNS